MAQHSPQRVKQQLEVIEARHAALREILRAPESSAHSLSRGNPLEEGIRRQYEKELKQLEAGIRYWRAEYRKLTGKSAGPGAKTFTQMEHERREERRLEAERRQVKQNLQHETEKARFSLDSLVTRLRSSRNHAADHWVRAFLVHQAGGVSYMIPWFVEKKVVPKAETALKKAKELSAKGISRRRQCSFGKPRFGSTAAPATSTSTRRRSEWAWSASSSRSSCPPPLRRLARALWARGRQWQ